MGFFRAQGRDIGRSLYGFLQSPREGYSTTPLWGSSEVYGCHHTREGNIEENLDGFHDIMEGYRMKPIIYVCSTLKDSLI